MTDQIQTAIPELANITLFQENIKRGNNSHANIQQFERLGDASPPQGPRSTYNSLDNTFSPWESSTTVYISQLIRCRQLLDAFIERQENRNSPYMQQLKSMIATEQNKLYTMISKASTDLMNRFQCFAQRSALAMGEAYTIKELHKEVAQKAEKAGIIGFEFIADLK